MKFLEKIKYPQCVAAAKRWCDKSQRIARKGRVFYRSCGRRPLWKKAAPLALNFLIVLVLAHYGYKSLNFVSQYHPLNDSGIFAAGGLHILEGHALYKDFWDHKPPVIHFLNAFAMAVGGHSILPVRQMEQLFAIAGMLLVFFILWTIFRSRLAAVFGAMLYQFQFYNNAVLEYGNLSEEYAAVFMLGGVLTVLWARRAPGLRSWILSALAGILFSLSAFTKEPFLFASFPWFVYLVFTGRKEWKSSLLRGLCFVAGSLIPAFFIVAYLVVNGALGAWLDVLSFNINNTAASRSASAASQNFIQKLQASLPQASRRVFAMSITARVLFGAGLMALAGGAFLKKTRYFSVALFFAFLANFYGAQLSARDFGHYFMELVPDFVLIAGSGVAFAIWLAGRGEANRWGRTLAIIPLAVALFAWDYTPVNKYWKQINEPAQTPRPEIIATFIKSNSTPDDTIWTQHQAISRYYVETNRLSATRYAYAPSHLFIDTRNSTRQEKIDQLKKDLNDHPPKFIVDWPKYCSYSRTLGVWSWIEANYKKTNIVSNEISLYVRNTPEYEHYWLFDPATDYNKFYSPVNFTAGAWKASDAINEQRRKYRPMLFYAAEEAAHSLEAIEAERYENKLDNQFRAGSPYASGGYMVADRNDKAAIDELRYTFYLEKDLPAGFLAARYSTESDGALYGVEIDGKEVGSLFMPANGSKGDSGFVSARMAVTGLKSGLHSLLVKNNGVDVNLDCFYFTEK